MTVKQLPSEATDAARRLARGARPSQVGGRVARATLLQARRSLRSCHASLRSVASAVSSDPAARSPWSKTNRIPPSSLYRRTSTAHWPASGTSPRSKCAFRSSALTSSSRSATMRTWCAASSESEASLGTKSLGGRGRVGCGRSRSGLGLVLQSCTLFTGASARQDDEGRVGSQATSGARNGGPSARSSSAPSAARSGQEAARLRYSTLLTLASQRQPESSAEPEPRERKRLRRVTRVATTRPRRRAFVIAVEEHLSARASRNGW